MEDLKIKEMAIAFGKTPAQIVLRYQVQPKSVNRYKLG